MERWEESDDGDQEIEFDGDCITLEIPENQSSTTNGWEIVALSQPLMVKH